MEDTDYEILGKCEPEFAEVQKVFAHFYKAGIDERSQLCVFVGDQCVVDLYGKPKSDQVFTADHTTCIFSSGKSIGAILMALLFEAGKFAYEDPVCKHWPEFAQNGKEAITIADVLRHEAGLPQFD